MQIIDGIYVLEVAKENNEYLEFCLEKIKKKTTEMDIPFGINITLDHTLIHSHSSYKLTDDGKIPIGKGIIKSLKGANNIYYEPKEIEDFVKNQLSQEQIESEVEKLRKRFTLETIRTFTDPKKEDEKHEAEYGNRETYMYHLAAKLGLYEKAKYPTFLIQFVGEMPDIKLKLDGFTEFLRYEDVGEICLGEISQLYIETDFALNVYHQVWPERD